MRICLTIIFYFCGFVITYADSPLTSIKFWDLSNDCFVEEIGKIPGKKRLGQSNMVIPSKLLRYFCQISKKKMFEKLEKE